MLQTKLCHFLTASSLLPLAGGWGHVLALTSNDQVLSFGWNQQGQLGLGDYESRRKPHVIRELSGKVARKRK